MGNRQVLTLRPTAPLCPGADWLSVESTRFGYKLYRRALNVKEMSIYNNLILERSKNMSEEKWQQVGEVGVDAGLLWLGDPCICVTPDASEHPAKTWKEFCDKLQGLEKKGVVKWPFKLGHKGLGVCISDFGGDGVFPVSVRRNARGGIEAVKIEF